MPEVGRITERRCKRCNKIFWTNAAGIRRHFEVECPKIDEEFLAEHGIYRPPQTNTLQVPSNNVLQGGLVIPKMRVRRRPPR